MTLIRVKTLGRGWPRVGTPALLNLRSSEVQQYIITKRYSCSEIALTGESRYHIVPPRGFEPVTLGVGSKQVSALDQ
jgi:hypothetical protein